MAGNERVVTPEGTESTNLDWEMPDLTEMSDSGLRDFSDFITNAIGAEKADRVVGRVARVEDLIDQIMENPGEIIRSRGKLRDLFLDDQGRISYDATDPKDSLVLRIVLMSQIRRLPDGHGLAKMLELAGIEVPEDVELLVRAFGQRTIS